MLLARVILLDNFEDDGRAVFRAVKLTAFTTMARTVDSEKCVFVSPGR